MYNGCPPLPETRFFTDDPMLICDLLKEEWALDIKDMPLSISYEPEQLMTDARTGTIYVYEVSHSAEPSTTDYRTLNRESHLNIRISNRFRHVHYMWVDEVYRILMANRRAGTKLLNGYTHMEVFVDRPFNDASGWYVSIVDVRLIMPHMPILSPGFGEKVNRDFAKAVEHHAISGKDL